MAGYMVRMSEPYTNEVERGFINQVLISNNFGQGEFIEEFEEEWAKFNKYKYGVACTSGSAALYLALKALNIGIGDEVIVPEFTMIACANAVSLTGAKPVFVDCRDDLNIDPDLIWPNEKTKAILAVAIYGRKLDEKIFNLGIPVIEDLAEAHGVMPRGDIVCYSFYGNKIITTGEGGMCLTNRKDLADEMQKQRNLYFDKERSLIHQKIGFNFRMTNMQAAVGLAQLSKIMEILRKRRKLVRHYDGLLREDFRMPERHVDWLYDIKVKEPEKVKAILKENVIECRNFFAPMSQQPPYLSDYEHLNAYKWSKQGLLLPLYPTLSLSDVTAICTIINNS